jgi:hypothetical protein
MSSRSAIGWDNCSSRHAIDDPEGNLIGVAGTA